MIVCNKNGQCALKFELFFSSSLLIILKSPPTNCWESRQKTKKIPSNDITNPKIYATRMYKYETGYGIHTFEDRTRGLRSRISVVDEA